MSANQAELPPAVPEANGVNGAAALDAAIQNYSAAAILSRYVDRPEAADVDVMERLAALAEREAAARAAEVFAQAITNFQSEMVPVQKHRQTKEKAGSDFAYRFADYSDVMRIAAPLLAKYKIVVTFNTEPPPAERPGMVGVCNIRVGTHVETSSLFLPIPKMTVPNDTQKFVGGMTYLKRVLLCSALNIVTTDEDDDGQSQFTGLTDAQMMEINDLIRDCEEAGNPVNLDRFVAWLGIEGLHAATAAMYPKIVTELKRKLNQKGGRK